MSAAKTGTSRQRATKMAICAGEDASLSEVGEVEASLSGGVCAASHSACSVLRGMVRVAGLGT